MINGISTSNSIPAGTPIAPQWWHPFLITSGFVQGTNTLDFVVQRIPWGGSTYLPTGLCAELMITNLPPPQLQIGIASHVVLIWWPTNTPAFVLETSTRPGPDVTWSLFPGPMFVIGSQNVAEADTSSPARFFRLHRR